MRACLILLLLSWRAQAFLHRSPIQRCCVRTLSSSEPSKEEETFSTKSKADELRRYYGGLINDPIADLQTNEEMAKRDNLTPNLRLAAIFVAILSTLLYYFVQANVDTPPFESLA